MEPTENEKEKSACALKFFYLSSDLPFLRCRPPRLMFARELEVLAVTTGRESAGKDKNQERRKEDEHSTECHSFNNCLDSSPMSPAQFGVCPRS